MEAVGLALSILPLIVSAAENYKKLFLSPLCRYQNFADEAGIYILRLKNQQAIFETKCIHLLAHVTIEELASAIIDNPNECATGDMEQVGGRLEIVTANSRDALVQTMEAINSILTRISKDSDKLSSAIKVEEEATKQSGRWRLLSKGRSHFRQKLRFSFSFEGLLLNLHTLTQLNQDFLTISDLVLLEPFPSAMEVLSEKPINGKLAIEHKAIGHAAEAISATLNRLSCNSQGTHLAALCVGNEEVLHSEMRPSNIEVEAVFHCATSCCNFLQFSVSALYEESSQDRWQTPEPHAAFESRRSIALKNTVPEQGSNRQSDSVHDPDACNFLSQSVRGLIAGDLFIIASLTHDRGRRAGAPMTRNSECPMKSETVNLSDLLDLPSDTTRRMPVYKRIWLAKTLAVAFFRYHHTAWAGPDWGSRRIYFQVSDVADAHQSSNLHQPWLRCDVRVFQPSRVQNADNLFALGAMLIEIGYSMNWESLSDTRQSNDDDTLRRFFQARRLLAQGLFDMGSAYRNIVEKLIESIFANGYDLEDQKSQGLFFEEIIRPLEEEERKLRCLLYG